MIAFLESSDKGHLTHLKASLRWAAEVGMISEAPKITMPHRAKELKHMKGRPITLEEFERMCDVIPKVVGIQHAESWRYFMDGLWESGLRINEALNFWWDRSDKPMPYYLQSPNRHPIIFIPAAADKGNEDRELPITPQFATHLLQTPESQRMGRVYSPTTKNQKGEHLTVKYVGRVITKLGKKANVKVSEKHDDATGEVVVKYASSHDLRRSFGDRLSRMPGINSRILKEFMRHKSISTTEKFYLSNDAQLTAHVVHEAFANTIANTSQNERKKEGLSQH